MKRTLLLSGAVVGAILGWLAVDAPSTRGAGSNASLPPASRTGAPGDLLCTECHTGNPVDDGVGNFAIIGVPMAYTPSQTYQISVGVERSGQTRWGFELVPLLDSDNTMAGTLTNTNPLTWTQTALGRTYVSHTTLNGPDGTLVGFLAGTWVFDWTAPAAGAGTVTFYAAGNAANNDNTSLGDFIYTFSIPSMEAARPT